MALKRGEFDSALEHAIRNAKIIYGAKRVLENARRGSLALIILANNIPEIPKTRIINAARLSGIPIVFYPDNALNLGMKCGKPFVVSALGIERGTKRLKIIDMVRRHGEREIQLV